jgi:hypothetical protein
VSHIPERTEKDCLNCGTIVQGRYCHVCGQENVVPKETFWHMVTHFFYDITHFDSSFFVTVKDLLFKPGFLSREYMLGKRKKYLHPIRMYVFTSAVFFLLFFSFFKVDDSIKTNADEVISPGERKTEIARLEKRLRKDTSNEYYKKGIRLLKDTSVAIKEKDILEFYGPNPKNFITLGTHDYYSKAEYDSIQHTLPGDKKDGWFMKRIQLKAIHINEKYRANPEEGFKKLGDSILHNLPYMLFVSLPLFALLLKMLYIRRKKFYYADHGVFTIHLYIFSFILLLVVFGIGKLQEYSGIKDFDWVIIALLIWLMVYLFLAMKRFYQQGWLKTFVKFLLTAVFSLLMMLILFLLFIFFSAFTL